ncbi:MAG: hypothetical protein JXB04_06045 [Kiritimatiellae bacterium]|nr:hypothetical protein [Kiritimatiellia bacterium]
MNSPRRWTWLVACALVSGGVTCGEAVEVEASAPQGVTLSAYDTGLVLVQELRRVTLAAGENLVRFRQLPDRLDPATISVAQPAAARDIEVLDQQFYNDLASTRHMLERYVGRAVAVDTPQGTRRGTLLSVPAGGERSWDREPLVIRAEDGSTVMFPEPGAVQGVTLPGAAQQAYTEPTLLWRINAKEEGPQNLRLHYATDGITWMAFYDLVLEEDGRGGPLSVRVQVENRSGGSFENARVRLVSTERGAQALQRWQNLDVRSDIERGIDALRYAYGGSVPTFEQWLTGQAPLSAVDLPRPLTLERGGTTYAELHRAGNLPVERFYVYDGVKFDRFQRNRRSDWNYGTESHGVVETHLQFSNSDRVGLGRDLPQGRFRLFQRRREGSVDLLGEDVLRATAAGELAHVRVGPARGLKGERERTGYTEVVPLHQYEETFEIRIENESSEDAEIRVVEHLYRWHDYEIVKADTEYQETGPQTIEFRPALKAGGKRSVHYTVRYTW